MSQTRTTTTSLFRTSLRDWQANYKARQATQPSEPEPAPAPAAAPAADDSAPAPAAPTRVKRLVARKRRKMKQAASEARR